VGGGSGGLKPPSRESTLDCHSVAKPLVVNRLARESSPYLLQHAGNPVHWWPWCEEAFAQARQTGKPVLLSIGYSACHWCHVMAHESFEDEASAEVMNRLFVNIKVDREERPDLDRIYQLAHQALTQRAGGWPLTLFLDAQSRLPFFAGTYFPKAARHGLPPFVAILERVRDWVDNHPDDLSAQNAALADFLADSGRAPASASGIDSASLEAAPIDAALSSLESSFDAVWGGFGGAPKFPHSGEIGFLLDAADRSDKPADAERWRRMALLSLRRMAEGGIHDQLGGGFCRYSVDARWEIPHFEKMLYDNALLLPQFARAAALSGEAIHRDAAEGIVDWLAREMRADDDGHFAALDADSDAGHGHPEEGAFYVWTQEQLRSLLSDADFALAAARFGFDRPANFEAQHWNPLLAASTDHLANQLKQPDAEIAARLDDIRDTLLKARAQRPRPGLDNKRLTAWNALLASGLFRAAGWLRRPDWAERGQAILRFLYAKVWIDGRLHASHQGGVARFRGYLDDHAFVLESLLDSMTLHPQAQWLDWARALADDLLTRFEDRAEGGFFFTADDHETLIARLKPFTDEATPSGNAVAARALLRLGRLTGDTRYLDAAERTLTAASAQFNRHPQACTQMLATLREWLNPSAHVVIRLPSAADPALWYAAAAASAARGTEAVLLAAEDTACPNFPATPEGVAYVCQGTHCLPPVRQPTDIARRLAEVDASSPGAPD